MAKIEAANGDNVAVTIKDVWIEKLHLKDGTEKLVAKVNGQDEKGGSGIATLWLTSEVRQGQIKSEITRNLELMETLGMEGGDIKHMADLLDKPATFGVQIKEGMNGQADKVNYYLRSPVEKLNLEVAADLIEQIRGKAAADEAAVSGTPVAGDDNLPW